MTTIIAIANQKGGVGKTTTTINLARAAHLRGLETLAIDMDPQGNLTSGLSEQPLPETVAGVADALDGRAGDSLEEVLVNSVWENVTLAPTVGEALGYVRDQLVIAGAGREAKLDAAIDSLETAFDLILIDCAPSLDQLTINALTAADQVLVVTHPSQFSSNGLARLLETIDTAKKYYNEKLIIGGVVINHLESNTINDRHWKLVLEEAAADRSLRVLTPEIPKRAAIKAATESQVGLDEWDEPGIRKLQQAYSGFLDALVPTK